MNASDWISLGALLGALAAFVSGLQQYLRAQKWERAEFVAKEIKEFESKRENRTAMQMLDWNSRDYAMPDVSSEKDRAVFIDDSTLESALVPHTEKPSGFSDEEVFVRDVFDEFFSGLERFENYIEAGLVSHTEFEPYLIYWIDIIGDPRSRGKPENLRNRIWSYVEFYGYDGVQKLARRYGYDIYPDSH